MVFPSARPTLLFGGLLSTLLLTGCSKAPEMVKIEGFAQGTTYTFTFELPANATVTRDQLAAEVDAEFARIDKALSNYRPDSRIEDFNSTLSTELLEVEAELVHLVERARTVYHASNGCYDLTMKPLFDAWGFKKAEFTPPTDAQLAEILQHIGMDKLETIDDTHLRKTLPQLRIDVSSIGQGYSVQKMSALLEGYGVSNYLVEVGGEMQVQGKKADGSPWRIALERPVPNEQTIHKIVSFDSGNQMSLMASGTYRHYFDSEGKRYSHIIDARSGKPVEHDTVSVTLFIDDATMADAWSTALLCLGSTEGLAVANTHGIPTLFIDQQGDELIEIESEALKTFKDVSITSP